MQALPWINLQRGIFRTKLIPLFFLFALFNETGKRNDDRIKFSDDTREDFRLKVYSA